MFSILLLFFIQFEIVPHMEQGSPAGQSSRIREEEFELNGRKFYRTSFFDISCIRCENGYYNFTKIAQDNGKRDMNEITRYKYWKDYIDAFKKNYLFDSETNGFILRISSPVNSRGNSIQEISEEMLSFTIQTRDEKLLELNGTYMPEDLLHFFCEHVNIDYAMKIASLIALINREIKLRNITLEQKIEEQVSLIESLQTRLRNSNAGFNHENAGTILCSKIRGSKRNRNQPVSPYRYHVYYKPIVLGEGSQSFKEGDMLIKNIYNIYEMKRLINFYMNATIFSFASPVHMNLYDITDLEAFRDFVYKLQRFEYEYKYDLDAIIRNYKLSHSDLSTYQRQNDAFGKFFEFYCSLKYHMQLFKYQPVEILGLHKDDIGADLIDISNKIIGQCKYYKERKITAKRIATFIDFVSNYTEDGWKAVLFINSDAKIELPKDITDFINIERVPVNEIEDFISSRLLDGRKIEEIETSEIEEEENEDNIISTDTSVQTDIQSNNESSLNISTSETIDTSTNKIISESPIRDYIKEQLETNSFIFLDDMIENINKLRETNAQFMHELHSPLNIKTFYKRYNDLYDHDCYGSLPKIDGRLILRTAIDKNDELSFIRRTIGDGEMPVNEYLEIHNSQFKTHYNSRSFTHRFRNIFQMQGKSILVRYIKGKKTTVLRLKND